MCIHYDVVPTTSFDRRSEQGETLLRLCSARSIDRVYLLCSWALSPNPELRKLAVAIFAIRSADLGGPSVLAHLAGDPLPEVRRLVAAAAHYHHDESPACYGAILRRLYVDPDPTVRAIARGETEEVLDVASA